jgi:hypothetical protein
MLKQLPRFIVNYILITRSDFCLSTTFWDFCNLELRNLKWEFYGKIFFPSLKSTNFAIFQEKNCKKKKKKKKIQEQFVLC